MEDLARPANPIVEIDKLKFSYPNSLTLELDHWSVAEGGHIACVGPSGCGKTTLLRLIAGIIRPDAGSIRTCGSEITSLSDGARRALRARDIGLVFQQFALLDYVSAFENILLPYRIEPTLKLDADARDRAEELAESLGVAHTLRRLPARLSQGERQRIAICRALVTQPRLVLCDEPTGNLDPSRSRESVSLIIQESEKTSATVICVTHDHGLLDLFDDTLDLHATTTGFTA